MNLTHYVYYSNQVERLIIKQSILRDSSWTLIMKSHGLQSEELCKSFCLGAIVFQGIKVSNSKEEFTF